MRVLILEPHPDDAAISAYKITQKLVSMYPGDVFLTSLFNSAPRSSEKWCESMGVKYLGINMAPDYLETKKFIPYTKYKKMLDLKEQLDEYSDIKTDPVVAKLILMVEDLIRTMTPDFMLSVVGIRHKGHVATRFITDSNEVTMACPKKAYYAEYPYASRQYAKNLLQKLTMPFEIYPAGGEEKISAFWNTYPSERGMLVYDKATISDTP